MTEEVKYNNTLVSGRADETLSYTRYIKDESSGKSTKELLDEKVNKTDQLGTTQIADNAVTNEKLAEHSVDNSKLSPDSVSYEKIQDDAVTTEKIHDGAITTEKVEEKAVTNQKLGDQSVDGRVVREASLETKHFTNESVTTEKVARKSITKDKLADNSVDNSQVVDGSIGNAKLSPDSVTTEKIKDSSVTNEKVANDTLGIEKFDPELRKTIQAATGLPEDLSQMIQDVDKSVKQLHEKDTDLQSQINDKQQQITSNDEDISLLQTRSTQMEEAIKGISASGGASVASAVTYENTESGLDSVTAQGAINELANKKFDKENIAQGFGESEDKVVSQFALPFREIESLEFLHCIVDAEDHFLFGIQLDGSIEWGKGIPAPIRAKLQDIINQCQQDKTDVLEAINAAKEELSASITTLQEGKVDKEEGKSLIEDEVKECFKVIENEEFIKVITDADDRVLFGIYRATGEPYYPLNEMYHVEQNEEFFALWQDAANHVLLGIRRDGEIIGEIHAVNALKQVISQLQSDLTSLQEKVGTIDTNLKELLDVFSLQENPEYMAVEKDADGKVLSATYNDGSHYSHNLKSETIDAKVDKEEGKSLIDADVADAHSTIEDSEGRMEITTDANDKVLAYRDSEGKKHEHSMETKNLEVSNLNLKGNSVNNIKDALKANGFDVKTPNDWSDYLSNGGKSPLCIPEPRCARINISGIDSMPTTKTTNAKAFFEMWDMQGNYFKKKVIINAQGNTTIRYPKKSFACNFFDSDWDGDSFAVKFGDWVSQDSFHFKAQYTDFFKGISIVAYKLVQEVWASRSPIYSNPWKKALLGNINITSGSYNNETINDLSLQKDTGAKCVPDAFPCVVYLNGDFYGVFNWALKKHRDNYHMNKSLGTNIHLDGGRGPMLSPLNWTSFEVRNPKGLLTNVATATGFESYDGDKPKELLGSDTEGYNPSDKKHVLSNKVKQSILIFNSMARELNAKTNENGGEDFLNTHYDMENLIDYYVLQYVLADEDISANWQWVTYDGVKWFICDYDKDKTFGQIYDCPGVRSADTMLNAVSSSSENYPFKYLVQYHKEDIKARYNELKSLGIFTPEHVISLVKNWFNRFPIEAIKLEYKKWSESPSNRDDNVDREHWKIKGSSYEAQDKDTYDNEKTYAIGETCAYGKSRHVIFECIKESTGNPPVTKFYDNLPYDLGYRDSIWRVTKYIQDRFTYIESEINKL